MTLKLTRPAALAILVLCSVLIGANAQAGCPEDSETVNISIVKGKITVPDNQQSVTIYMGTAKGKSKVCWVIEGLGQNHTLFFDRKSTTDGKGFFPDLKKKVKGSPGKTVIERVGVPKREGSWHYALELKTGSTVNDVLDPTIIILGGSSGAH